VVVAAYRIEVNGRDVTDKWQRERRLLSVEITDKLGVSADSCSLELDDRPPHVAWPPAGATLRIWLGPSSNELRDLGTYTLDVPEASGPPHRLQVIGHAASFISGDTMPMHTQRSRVWQDVSFADLAEAIAAEHGLNVKVASSLQGLSVGVVEQIDEADLEFLGRLAARFDARARVRTGQLEIMPAGPLTQAAVRLSPSQLEGWFAPLGERLKPGRVVARWNAPTSGKAGEVTAGEEAPTLVLSELFDGPDSAKKAALAAFDARDRNAAQIALALATLRTDIGAGAMLEMEGIRGELDGLWTAVEVVHRAGGTAARTAITAQREAT
jgi:phage protein D